MRKYTVVLTLLSFLSFMWCEDTMASPKFALACLDGCTSSLYFFVLSVSEGAVETFVFHGFLFIRRSRSLYLGGP